MHTHTRQTPWIKSRALALIVRPQPQMGIDLTRRVLLRRWEIRGIRVPAGRMIRLSAAGQLVHPLYVVAAADPREAIKVLENAGVVNGCTPEDIGPISERLIERLGLRPRQFVRIKADKQK